VRDAGLRHRPGESTVKTPLRPRSLLPVLLLTLAGCAETRLYSGLPPGDPPSGFENRWHHSFLFGTTDAGPYDLSRLCPKGWSEISVAPDFFTTIVGAATLFLYTPNRLTLVCARPIELNVPRPAVGAP
jgi:hypothetical protein